VFAWEQNPQAHRVASQQFLLRFYPSLNLGDDHLSCLHGKGSVVDDGPAVFIDAEPREVLVFEACAEHAQKSLALEKMLIDQHGREYSQHGCQRTTHARQRFLIRLLSRLFKESCGAARSLPDSALCVRQHNNGTVGTESRQRLCDFGRGFAPSSQNDGSSRHGREGTSEAAGVLLPHSRVSGIVCLCLGIVVEGELVRVGTQKDLIDLTRALVGDVGFQEVWSEHAALEQELVIAF